MVSIGRGSRRDRCEGRFGWGDLIDVYGETGSDPVTFRYADPPRGCALRPGSSSCDGAGAGRGERELAGDRADLEGSPLRGTVGEGGGDIDVAQLPLDLDDLAIGPTP